MRFWLTFTQLPLTFKRLPFFVFISLFSEQFVPKSLIENIVIRIFV